MAGEAGPVGPLPTGDGLAFQEAIDFFRQKTRIPTKRWDDLRHGAYVRGFAVAGAQRDDLLADFQGAIDKAISEGTSLDEFRKDFDKIVAQHGWSYNGSRGWRSRTIYQTNLNVAYSAGRYAQMTDPDTLAAFPIWVYRHSGSVHPRHQHLAWDGLALLADDPFWKTHYGPNGWGCGCWVDALSRRQLRAMGKDGPDQAPTIDTYPYVDKQTGETIHVPVGIDPGWDYNPGEHWLRGVVPRELQEPLGAPGATAPFSVTVPPMPVPTKVPRNRLLPAGKPETFYVDAFLSEFKATRAQAVAWRDPTGTVLTISDELFRNAAGAYKVTKEGREVYLRLLADALKAPDEIWLHWQLTKSGPQLRRRYLRQTTLPGGEQLFLTFEWGNDGWLGITAFQPKHPDYMRGQRTGVMLYQRQ
jgi:hypothetical protein